jgi:hypothetical protein
MKFFEQVRSRMFAITPNPPPPPHFIPFSHPTNLSEKVNLLDTLAFHATSIYRKKTHFDIIILSFLSIHVLQLLYR